VRRVLSGARVAMATRPASLFAADFGCGWSKATRPNHCLPLTPAALRRGHRLRDPQRADLQVETRTETPVHLPACLSIKLLVFYTQQWCFFRKHLRVDTECLQHGMQRILVLVVAPV
jgi:hypothetical protein